MNRDITRRDLINGIAVCVGAGLLAPTGALARPTSALTSIRHAVGYYPPTETGMRGSHPGSFEVAHDLAWRGQKPAEYTPLDEHYDLVVVGAGASGLAAAWHYRRKMGHDSRILILDNHDDFGGHAKRNEFHHDGRMVVGLGGAQNMEPPSSYSKLAGSILEDIGIDQGFRDKLKASTPDDFALGSQWNADWGMAMPGEGGHTAINGNWVRFMQGDGDYVTAIRQLPIPAAEQNKLIALVSGDNDFFGDLSLIEKWRYINSVSYNQFLSERIGLSDETIAITNAWLVVLGGYTGWHFSVLEAVAYGSPGLRSLGWLGKAASKGSLYFLDYMFAGICMFPDGNASVARLLVHKMIPAVAPDMKGVDDVVATRFDYSKLDLADHPTRLRLSSTAVGVREVGGKHVQVDYVQHGKPFRVTTDHCVLACYNGIVPHLCPEMSEEQKDALKYGVKVPFVYANVLLKDGKAFSKLGATFYQCPTDPFQWISTAPPTAIGGYEPPRSPEDPMLVFMMSSPMGQSPAEMTARDASRMGRHKIYNTAFETYEQQIRDQLQSLLGKHGFNHATDLEALTVNRIPHGYAYSYSTLFDPKWEDGKAPHEIGRAQFGRISIANSDSLASPSMQAAFDAGIRAVEEQTA